MNEKTKSIMDALLRKPQIKQPFNPVLPPNRKEKSSGTINSKIPPFMSKEDTKNLEGMLKTHTSKVEVEASFGTFRRDGGKSFYEPGVSIGQFNTVLSYLLSLDNEGLWGNGKKRHDLTITIEETEETPRKTKKGLFKKLRRIENVGVGTIIWLDKNRHRENNIDDEEWGYRIASSSEKLYSLEDGNVLLMEAGDTLDLSGFNPSFKRRKERRTFMAVSEDSEFYGIKFDLTRVEETDPKNITKIKHEIEIERESANANVKTFEKAIEMIIRVMQKVSVDDNKGLLTLSQRNETIKFHNTLFKEDAQKTKFREADEYCLFKGYENKPENIKENDLLNPENKYQVTVKVDGVRNFILITSKGIFSCSPPKDIWKIGEGNENLKGTLIDAEVYKNPKTGLTTYYLFDILFYQGRDIRKDYFVDKNKLPGRFSILKKISDEIRLYKDLTELKIFHSGSSFYDNVNKAFEDSEKMNEAGIKTDGLIFQSHLWYKNFFTRKWKPVEDLTIDFKLLPGESPEEFILNIQGYGEGKREVSTGCGSNKPLWIPFMGSKRNPNTSISIIKVSKGVLKVGNSAGLVLNPFAENLIVECFWNDEKKIFVPVRYRDDKENPNFIRTVESVWDDIMDPMTEETIRGNTLIAMRRFHNLCKMHFLKKEFKKGDKIMDWGSGRGGDLNKWKKMGLSKVYVVEPNDVNFAEFQKRQTSMEAEWSGKSEKYPKIIPISTNGKMVGSEETEILAEIVEEPLDGIVSFFSLTFFGKDKKMFDKMIHSIDTMIDVGGKFLGIVMDGNRTQELLEQDEEAEKGQSLLYDCPAFSIRQKTKFSQSVEKGSNEIKIIIKESTSMVKQTEWLFHFENLKKALLNIGFELSYEGFLDQKESPLLSIGGEKGKERPPQNLFPMLPEAGKLFSSLNRYFLFTRVSRKASKKVGTKESSDSEKGFPLDERVIFDYDIFDTLWKKSSVPQKDFFLVKPVPGDVKYGIIHSILYAVSSNYRNLDLQERIDYVQKIVNTMARNLDVNLFKDEEEYLSRKLEILEGKIDDSTNEGANIFVDSISHLIGINILRIKREGKYVNLDTERGTFGCFQNTILIYTDSKAHGVILDSGTKGVFFAAYKTKTELVKHLIKSIAENKTKIRISK